MTNFSINFSNPWLLLLLIPAGLLTLIPYFRLNKRYRCTRNRIVSIVLHLIIMVLSISVLAGLTFDYDKPNSENEVILLVDSSFSGSENEQEKDDFIQSVIMNSDSKFKVGIVTFGFDQVYAVELTNDTNGIFSKYLQAPSPDTTATDIEAALDYTAELFNHPETARIVLISDGIETDGSAMDTIRSVAAKGIKVDTVCFNEREESNEVQLIEMTRPEERIKVGEDFNVSLTLQSSFTGVATITPYDNDVAGESFDVELTEGIQTIQVPYNFSLPGMHKMSFELTSPDDTLAENNVFNSYIYLEIFDKILVIESIVDESEALCRMLKDELKVTVVNVDDEENMPKTLRDLRAYDEIILCNISNDDLPDGFDEILYSYVYDIGGGLFTICGNEQDSAPGDEDWTANAYTREDMYGTLYQQMLPVEAINYTPPVAVMIIIDRSGSMYDPNGTDPYENSKLFYAKQGAEACLDALTERDYVGIMSLGDDYQEQISITPRPQRDKILAAIDKIEGGGGTVFSDALERAGKALSAMSNVDKKHIIIVTDGEPSGEDEDRYLYWFEENAKLGITTSIVGIQCTASAKSNMQIILEEHAGVSKDNFHDVDDITRVPTAMREDLEAPEIKDVNYTTFQPTINSTTAITAGVKQEDIPTLDGFYGLKLKEGAQAILMGEYTPIYAQWTFGKGTVGTFACDLNGTWSSNFIDTDPASIIVNNIVTNLFPVESVRPQEIDVTLKGDNYKTQMNVFTELLEGETIEITVKSPAIDGSGDGSLQTLSAGFGDVYTRFNFAVTVPGIHEITATRKDSAGNILASTTTHKALPYSKEYNVFADTELAKALMKDLAKGGEGMEITDPWQVFENAVKYLHVVIDPKIVFMIIVLVLFLLDIAVRKFKWKWPHEIIRDKKAIAEQNERRA